MPGIPVSYVVTERPVYSVRRVCPRIQRYRIVTGRPYLLQLQDKAGVCNTCRLFLHHRVDEGFM